MKVKVEKSFCYILLALIVPMEAISGFAANYGGGLNLISYMYRILSILYFSNVLLKKTNLFYLIATILVVAGVLFNSFFYTNSNFSYDIIIVFRLVYFETLCLGICHYISQGKIDDIKLKKIFNISTDLLIFIYLISILLGVGLTTYSYSSSSVSAGYKAVFNSVNSLTLALIILSSYQLSELLNSNNKICICRYLILSAFIFLLGTKAGIMLWVLYLAYSFRLRLNSKYFRRIAIILPLIAVLIVFISKNYSSQIQIIINRYLYFYSSSSSVLEFLSSGRINLLQLGWLSYFSNITFLDLVWGKGCYNIQSLIGGLSLWADLKGVEMDFFDLLFAFGFCGLIITYILSFNMSRYKHWLKSRYFVLYLVCIIFSILGGHVFMDSFGSGIVSLVVGLLFIDKKRCRKYEKNSNITFG